MGRRRVFDPASPSRQYRVTHKATLETWLVEVNITTEDNSDRCCAARMVGFQYPVDCSVAPATQAERIALPFGLPLRVRPPARSRIRQAVKIGAIQ